MNWNAFLGDLYIYFFLLPVILLVFLGLYVNKSLVLFGIYCLMNAAHGMMVRGVFPVDKAFRVNYAVITNYLDTPMMLLVLLLFCHHLKWRRLVVRLAVLFSVYELVVAAWLGLDRNSVLAVSGPGLLLVFGLSLHFFVQQLKQTVRHGKGIGRTLLAAAIFFVYGCYNILFYFYYLEQVAQVADVFLLYHFASIVFCLLASLGLLHLGRLHKKVTELKQVRKELAAFY